MVHCCSDLLATVENTVIARKREKKSVTYVAGFVRPWLRAGDVLVVDAIRAAVLEHVLEKCFARFGRVWNGVGLRVQDDVGVARLVGGVAGPELLAGEWRRGGDGGAGKYEDRRQLHLERLKIGRSDEVGYKRVGRKV